MKRRLLFVFCCLLFACIGFAQPKQKAPVKPTIAELKKILSGRWAWSNMGFGSRGLKSKGGKLATFLFCLIP
jgi:hypothetical protein